MIDIIFLSLRPEKAEYITGQDFGGSFGHLAKDMIINAGIDIKKCLFRYVYSHPVKDSEEELASVQKLIQRIRPKITVLLGSGAMKLFFPNHRSLDKHRGSLYFTEYGKMMATFDPIIVMKQYTKRYITELDLKRALLESSSWTLSIPEMNFIIRPTFEQVMEFLRKPHKRLSFDVETAGKRIRCLGFSDKKNHAICIPFMAKTKEKNEKMLFSLDLPTETVGSYWTIEEESAILTELNRIFLDKRIQKIAQNYPFDSMVLAREFGFHIEGLHLDTMVAMHCCYSELPKSLDFLTSIFTKIPYYADHEVSNDESEWIYNCYDCAATFEVAEKLEQEMVDLQVNGFYQTHAQPTMLALTRAGNRGIEIDVKLRTKLKAEAEESLKDVIAQIKDKVGFDLNPNSPKQMKEYLYVTKRYKKQKKLGKVSAGVDALTSLMSLYPQDAKTFQLFLEYRKQKKLIGAFLDLQLTGDNKYLTSYNATGTKTGRISSSKLFFDEGGNIQQTPRGELRRIFKARKGKVLIKVDLAQAEARAVAFYARDFVLIQNFNNPKFDIHKWNAALIEGIPMENLSTEDIIEKVFPQITKEQRTNAKHSLHSANYRGGPYAAMKHSGVSFQQAKRAQENWKKASPHIMTWWKNIEKHITQTRRHRTAFGRLRIYFDRLDMPLFRSATAQLPQSTVGDQINRAFFMLDEALPEGCYPLIQVHDEIVCEVDENKIDECIELIRKYMEYPIYIDDIKEPLIIPADISVGPNWFDQVEV